MTSQTEIHHSEDETSLLPPREADEWFRCSLCYKGMKEPANAACGFIYRGMKNDLIVWMVVAQHGCRYRPDICQECWSSLMKGQIVGTKEIRWMGQDDNINWDVARRGYVPGKVVP